MPHPPPLGVSLQISNFCCSSYPTKQTPEFCWVAAGVMFWLLVCPWSVRG